MNKRLASWGALFIAIPYHPLYMVAAGAVLVAAALCIHTTNAYALVVVSILCIVWGLRKELSTCILALLLFGGIALRGHLLRTHYEAAWSRLGGHAWIVEGILINQEPGDPERVIIQPEVYVSARAPLTLEAELPLALAINKPDYASSPETPQCYVGARVITGPIYLQPPQEALARYALRQQILTTVAGIPLTCVGTQQRVPWSTRWGLSVARSRWQLYQRIAPRLRAYLSPRAYNLLQALIMGKSPPAARMEWEEGGFGAWGIFHIVARSGLHVTLVLTLLTLLLSLLPLGLRLKNALLLTILTLYALFTWSSVSFIRALAMVVLYRYALVRGRRGHWWYILHLALIGILLYNPFLISGLDMQLSFGFTYVLLWLSQIARQEQIFKGRPLQKRG